MFRCQVCRILAPAHTPSHRLVVQRRAKAYPPRPKANIVIRRNAADIKMRRREVDDPGGSGTEIVREIIACAGCAN